MDGWIKLSGNDGRLAKYVNRRSIVSVNDMDGGIVAVMRNGDTVGMPELPPDEPKLPYDAEVEWLESTGTQYIDTGIVEADPRNFAIEIHKVSGNFSFGFCHANVVNGTWLGVRSRFSAAYYKTYDSTVSYSNGNFQVLKWDGNKGFFVDGDKVGSFKASVGTDSISAQSWTVFGMRDFAYSARVNTLYSGCIREIKIWQSGALVRDFIPVRVGTTGYMFDRVSGELFGNAGTGAFAVGPDK